MTHDQRAVAEPVCRREHAVARHEHAFVFDQRSGVHRPNECAVTIGMTNQWHFYVVTNIEISANFTNAAFVTFEPDTLSIPRKGVFADSEANATRPEADIDLYVSTDPGLTNLASTVISNCIVGTQVGVNGRRQL